MAITFRGQASKLNKISANQNPNGFQEVSAPGPRRGVGGEENSPMKNKNFYGGEAYFQDGYGGDLASPVKSKPITQRSKSSPLKMNDALVSGASLVNKKFVDVGAAVAKGFAKKEEPKAADLSNKQSPPEEEEEKDIDVSGVGEGAMSGTTTTPIPS